MFELIISGLAALLLLGVWLEWRLHRQMNRRPKRIRWSSRKFEKTWDRHALRWLAQMRTGIEPQTDYFNVSEEDRDV